ncbi:MAG TPA: RICIN domain-containing protein [Mycobacteriales bacterium]|nr:RICIN domain-containing protein [Mycobacteriales bacterium]
MLRKTVGLLVSGISAMCFMVAAAPAAHADIVPPVDGWAELFPPFNNPGNPKCADVPNGTSTPEQILQVFHCHGYASNGAPQRFRFISLGDGTYWIQNLASGLCMEATVDGLEVEQNNCFATDRFRWQFLPTAIDPNAFQLRNIYFNCLGLQNVPVQDHDRLKLRPCQSSTSVLTTELQRMIWKLG